jgi:hypothetical protein
VVRVRGSQVKEGREEERRSCEWLTTTYDSTVIAILFSPVVASIHGEYSNSFEH